jgi:hypothetical protein
MGAITVRRVSSVSSKDLFLTFGTVFGVSSLYVRRL